MLRYIHGTSRPPTSTNKQYYASILQNGSNYCEGHHQKERISTDCVMQSIRRPNARPWQRCGPNTKGLHRALDFYILWTDSFGPRPRQPFVQLIGEPNAGLLHAYSWRNQHPLSQPSCRRPAYSWIRPRFGYTSLDANI